MSSARWTTPRLLALLLVLAMIVTACGNGGDDPAPQDDADAEEAGDEGDDGDGGDDGDDAQEATGDPITVGVVTATSGLLGAYGQDYLAGLEAGLAYATDGGNAVDGRPIEFEVVDDAGDPERAVSAVVDLVGRGVTIIAGTVSSGAGVQVAPLAEENNILYISGPAATDALTGINRNTFRSGRQTYQDVATAATLVDDIDGATVVVFVQDSEFGAANVAGVEAVLGAQGANVDSVAVPLSANEFTPFAQQVLDKDPDLVFVAWAGETTAAMWQTMEQQGVFEQTTVTTGLAERATWDFYGPAASEIDFLNHYFPGAPDNEANDYLVENASSADLFTVDGFNAAMMIVQAISEAGPDDIDGMIGALEGWTFEGPKGEMTIRASDHALLQPMFAVRLVEEDGGFDAELLNTLSPDEVAPPESN